MRKVFLKLDGINGASPGARHQGEIEVSSFYWGESQTAARAFGNGRGRASKDGLTIIKRTDQTTTDLLVAALTGQSFQGLLTLEDFSAEENLVRSIVFELQTVSVRSVTEIKNGEVINLSCKSIKLRHFAKGKDNFLRESARWFRRAVNNKLINKQQIIQ